jgi:hypothetical protein
VGCKDLAILGETRKNREGESCAEKTYPVNAEWFLRAQIVRWVRDDQPGFVDCQFKDAFGRDWSIIEKAPVVTSANVWFNRVFPQPAFVACAIVSRGLDDIGREIAEITTRTPWAIEATDGTNNFRVFLHQLTQSTDP